jgi:hypothetical protein
LIGYIYKNRDGKTTEKKYGLDWSEYNDSYGMPELLTLSEITQKEEKEKQRSVNLYECECGRWGRCRQCNRSFCYKNNGKVESSFDGWTEPAPGLCNFCIDDGYELR